MWVTFHTFWQELTVALSWKCLLLPNPPNHLLATHAVAKEDFCAALREATSSIWALALPDRYRFSEATSRFSHDALSSDESLTQKSFWQEAAGPSSPWEGAGLSSSGFELSNMILNLQNYSSAWHIWTQILCFKRNKLKSAPLSVFGVFLKPK